LLSNLRPPLSAFTSSFRHQESAGFEDLKLKVYFRGCAGSTRQKRFGSDRANLSQYGRLKHARTHARVCEGTRNSKGAGSTAAAAFANPDASPESTPTQHSPDPAAAPRSGRRPAIAHLPIDAHPPPSPLCPPRGRKQARRGDAICGRCNRGIRIALKYFLNVKRNSVSFNGAKPELNETQFRLSFV